MEECMGRCIVKKVVVIGDGAVGKTALLVRYRDDQFPDKYIPTVFEMSAKKVVFEDKEVELRLWDTAGQEEYEALRKQAYPGAAVIIIAFSLVNRDSFANIPEWKKDFSKEAPDAKIVLVGTKEDLVDNEEEVDKLTKAGQTAITEQEHEAMGMQVGAAACRRCSALTGKGVDQVFEDVVRVSLQKPGQARQGGENLGPLKCCNLL